MRSKTAILTFALGCALASAAGAQPAAAPAAGADAALSGAELYQQRTCVACHGKDANSPILPVYPKLAGQNAAYLLQQMQDIKSGARSNGNSAAMRGVMHLASDEELKAIAAWIAALPR